MADTDPRAVLAELLKAAQRSGIAHNNGAGGQYLLCATEQQLLAFGAVLSTPQARAVPSEYVQMAMDAAGNQPAHWARVLRTNLAHLSLGSCSCLTKTPEASAHRESCRYRWVCEASDAFDAFERVAAPPVPAPPAQAGEPPAIDYPALIAYCFKTLKHPQGTSGCIAFSRGAEWFRAQVAAQPPKGGA